MKMKLCMWKLDDTLSQNGKDGGPSWLDDFSKNKYVKRMGKILGQCRRDWVRRTLPVKGQG